MSEARQALEEHDPGRAASLATSIVQVADAPFLPGSEGAWVEMVRQRLQRRRTTALGVLAEAALLAGDQALAVANAETALAADPLDETFHRLLMQAHAASGNRAQALLAYARCRELTHSPTHAPVSAAAVRATTMRWDSSTTQADAGSRVPLGGIAALLRECTEWLDRLDHEEVVPVNLREATDPQTEYVPADRAQVRQVLQEIAREIEGLEAGSAPANDEPGGSRRERLASLLPKPARLSPHEERAQLRRQFGLEP